MWRYTTIFSLFTRATIRARTQRPQLSPIPVISDVPKYIQKTQLGAASAELLIGPASDAADTESFILTNLFSQSALTESLLKLNYNQIITSKDTLIT